jgi:hypothetical protein
MPRAKVYSIDKQEHLVDAKTIAALYGRTPQWVNRLARLGLIRWHGVRSGARVCRRFDPNEVRHDLSHDREVSHASA